MDFRIADWIQALAAFDSEDWNSIGFWAAVLFIIAKYPNLVYQLFKGLQWLLKWLARAFVGVWHWLLHSVSR